MQTRIPLPQLHNEAFSDALDYLEKIRERKQKGEQEKAKLAQDQKQFDVNKTLEEMKLKELREYHQGSLAQQGKLDPLRMELLRARIEQARSKGEEVKLSPQERTQSMKLLEAGRSLKSVLEKAQGIDLLLQENPNLTGYKAGFKSMLNKPGGKVAQLIEKSGNLQSAIGRLASQRGGAQVLKWAEKVKPSVWKDVQSNLGMTSSILEDTGADFEEVKNEFEALTGKPFPIQMPTGKKKGKKVKVKDNQTGEIHEMSEEEAKKLIEGG